MELDGWARSFQPESPGDQSSSQKVARSSKDGSPLHPTLSTPKVPGSRNDDSGESSDTDTDIRNRLRKLSVTPNSRRYFGKSSGINLIRSALSVKNKASNAESPGVDSEPRLQRRHDFWHIRPVSSRLPNTLCSPFSDRPALVGA